MPSYKVTAPGFHDGKYYHPEGKRRVLHTDKPYPKKELPSWLEEMKPETATQKKKRLAIDAEAAESAAKKAEQDQKDITNASFMGDGEAAGGSVETLG